MFVIVEHEIEKPEKFWDTSRAELDHIPDQLMLHYTLPNEDGTRAVFLWEAISPEAVRDYVQRTYGAASRFSFYVVDEERAVGLPHPESPAEVHLRKLGPVAHLASELARA